MRGGWIEHALILALGIFGLFVAIHYTQVMIAGLSAP
jgi:hypothetical protein